VDVPGEKLPADLPGYLAREVAPELPESLQAAFLEAAQSGNIRSMQNKQLSCQPLHQPGEGKGRGVCVCGLVVD
jgi:squalene monooxygenase